ncbi:hypothetical protein [Streptomyces sp. W1SF4]|uniref:hypothetical protein n=1 Tax=Streptomyces sp. W1SF4 TaxID=2305220 RepID=UPI000F7085A8|nr:hypothetical protein [Streptomyces sp. W1SF4]AZM87469.1 hypothetical protein D1J60_02265 [Streptomyces sp. W1SF4]
MDIRPAALRGERTPEPEELLEIAYDVGRDYHRWRPRLAEAGGEGCWLPLHRADALGVWALGWDCLPPGAAYLDHERMRGAVFVARGALTHERARLGNAPHTDEVGAGNGFCFDETFYHRMRPVGEAGPTVTVHVFALTAPEAVAGHDPACPALWLGLPSTAADRRVPGGGAPCP